MSYGNRGLGLRYKTKSHQTTNKFRSHNVYTKYQENNKTKEKIKKKELGVRKLSKYREEVTKLQL